MALAIENFRRLDGSRLVISTSHQGEAIQARNLSFGQKLTAWRNGATGGFSHGTVVHQAENRQFKAAFYNALVQAEGPGVARNAARAAGLSANWLSKPSAMSASTVKQVLASAQKIRQTAIVHSARNGQEFATAPGQYSLTGTLRASADASPEAVPDRELKAIFYRALRQHPEYGQRDLTDNDFMPMAQAAVQSWKGRQQARFQEAHPGLHAYQQAHPADLRAIDRETMFATLRAKLDPAITPDHMLAAEAPALRTLLQNTLDQVKANSQLLGRMSFDPAGLVGLKNDLVDQAQALRVLEQRLDEEQPASVEGQHLQRSLVMDLRHQTSMLQSKAGFVDDVRHNDPLSKKAVAYSDRLWAEAAAYVLNEAIDILTAMPLADGSLPQRRAIIEQARDDHMNDRQAAHTAASDVTRSADPKAKNHPASLARTQTLNVIKVALTAAGIPKDEITRLTSSNNLNQARRLALNANNDWNPYSRDMVVTRGDITRTYRSIITPGAAISTRFGRRYAATVPLDGATPAHPSRQGISSAEKADHYHARNLKVSELQHVDGQNNVRSMAKVVGHGVLDMWEISDPQERQVANERGAREVLEAALATNVRALTQARAGGNLTLTHVSVNLITPHTLRENRLGLWLAPDYQELTFTEAQFRAFTALSSAATGAPTKLHVVDPQNDQLDRPVNVNINPITFSFAINPIATAGGDLQKKFVWDNVYEHNRAEMIKFVGDVGTGGATPRGSRVGGFIGQVRDRLLAQNDPNAAELAAKLRDQADTVRSLFSSQAYRTGDGDPAKMGREILALQALAEQALSLMNVDDMAATMSKGCKSDKDRGGVTDLELKHKLITEEMGGQIIPNQTLRGDDQENYYIVAAGSGQLENQQLNTGLSGSKEAGKLKERIPDAAVRQYLSGLGALASE